MPTPATTSDVADRPADAARDNRAGSARPVFRLPPLEVLVDPVARAAVVDAVTDEIARDVATFEARLKSGPPPAFDPATMRLGCPGCGCWADRLEVDVRRQRGPRCVKCLAGNVTDVGTP